MRVKRNFKLLSEDIFYWFKNYKERKNIQEAKLSETNRKEVLHLYRIMLKNVPPLQNSKFEEKKVYEQIKFNFREGSRETNFDLICLLKNTCYSIIDKVNKRVYPPFPFWKV